MHQYQDLITIFHDCFFENYNTQLIKGEDEPIYLPADEQHPHNRLIFANGFFSSALHECSHWLIAGQERRTQVDFGYWYAPDGRTARQQELFQQFEVKPQAIEWILSIAARYPFRISLDNLNGSSSDAQSFKLAIYQQVKTYCEQGLTQRAQALHHALCQFYGTSTDLKIEDFDINTIS